MADAKRKLMIEILSDASGVKKGAEEASGHLSGMEKAGLAAAAGVAAIGGAAVDFGKKSVDAFQEVASHTFALQRLTGGSATAMSGLAFAGEEVGVSFESLEKGIKKYSKAAEGATDAEGKRFDTLDAQNKKSQEQLDLLNKVAAPTDAQRQKIVDLTQSMSDNNEEMSTLGLGFSKLGISMKDEDGNQKNTLRMMEDTAEIFKGMPDGIEKTALAQKLFGKSGADLIPLLDLGKQGIIDYMKQGSKLGTVIGQDMVDANQKNVMATREMHAAMKGFMVTVGSMLMPIITKFTTWMAEHLPAALKIVHEFIEKKVVPIIKVLWGWFQDYILPVLKTLKEVLLGDILPAFQSIWGFLMDHKEVLIGIGVAIAAILVPAFVGWAVAAGTAAIATIAAAAPVIALGVVIAALATGVVFAVKLIIDHWSEIVDFFEALPGKILDFLKGLPDLLLDLGKKLLGGLLTGIKWLATTGLYDYFIGFPLMILGWMGDVASWLFDVGKKVLGGLWDGIKWLATTGLKAYFIDIPVQLLLWIGKAELWLWDKGMDVLKGMLGGIKAGAISTMEWLKDLPGKILGWIGDGGSILWDFGKKLISGIWDGVKAGWNWFADQWNDGMGKLKIPKVHIPGTNIDIGGWGLPDLPKFKALGGSVSAGMPYIVGERGPELMVPGQSGTIIPHGQFGAAGASNVYITVNAGMGTDPRGVADAVVAAVTNWRNRNGPAPWMR